MQEKRINWTVVLSGQMPDGLAEHLAGRRGLELLAIPDFYDLPADHVALSAVHDVHGPICFVSNYLPRAAYWMLHWRGIKGRRADVERTATTGRKIHPVCVAGCDQAQAVSRILAVNGSGESRGHVRSVVDNPPQRWYPVIDYDRCTGCMACVEFCLFGVYEAAFNGGVVVAAPQQCKMGCPACSWTCPAGAIMFPRYAEGGPVAGAEEGLPRKLEGDELRQAAKKSIGQWEGVKLEVNLEAKPAAAGEQLDKIIDELEQT